MPVNWSPKDGKLHSLRKYGHPGPHPKTGRSVAWCHRCQCGLDFGRTTVEEAQALHRAHKRELGVWGA